MNFVDGNYKSFGAIPMEASVLREIDERVHST